MKAFKQLLNENQKIVIKKPWGVEIKDYKSGDPIPAGTKFKIFDAKDTAKIDAYADSLDESVVNEDSKRKPYFLKNAKVGDVFRDSGDLSREYKITKVTPSKVYATCVKQPSTTAEYNRSSSEYNETDPQYTKLFTMNEGFRYTSTKNLKVGDVFSENPKSTTWFKVDKIEGSKILTSNIDDKSDKLDISKYDDYKVFIKESVVSEATMSDIPHEIDDQIHKLKDMRFDLEETSKNWKLAGLDVTPLTNVIIGVNNLIDTMYKNGAKLADQEIIKQNKGKHMKTFSEKLIESISKDIKSKSLLKEDKIPLKEAKKYNWDEISFENIAAGIRIADLYDGLRLQTYSGGSGFDRAWKSDKYKELSKQARETNDWKVVGKEIESIVNELTKAANDFDKAIEMIMHKHGFKK